MQPHGSVGTAAGRQQFDFDLFVSYKSEDVRLARLITEELLSRGIVVWCAEYTMRPSDAACPDAALEKGVKRSRYGFIISNERYSRSEYCRLEARLLIEHCGFRGLLQLKLPDESLAHPEMPDLAAIRGDQVLSNVYDISQILDFIHTRTELQFDPSYEELAFSQPRIYYSAHDRYSLDVAGWGDLEERTSSIGPFVQGRTLLEGSRVEWRVVTQSGLFVELRPLPWGPGIIDDREFLRDLLASAEANLRRANAGHFPMIRKAQWAGAHLVFKYGYSHIGVTYRAVDRHGELCWVRGYVLVLPLGRQPFTQSDPLIQRKASSALGNVIFTFVFFCYGSFQHFVKCAKYMDRMVDSFKWDFAPSQ